MGNKKAIVQVIGINVENEERINTLLKNKGILLSMNLLCLLSVGMAIQKKVLLAGKSQRSTKIS